MEKLIGNAVVGQSGGPTSAINATLAGIIRGVLEGDGTVKTLYGMKNGIEGLLREELVDLNAFFADGEKLDLLERTPAAALGSCRKKLPDPESGDRVYEDIIAIFKKYDIRYFFYIGGNDSMDAVAKLSKYSKHCNYEMRIIGVPKTIDNDLCATDHCPGFGSAAKYIATTLQEIIRDCAVYTTRAVTVVEIMGRDAGWLTASSGIGKYVNGIAPDLVYLPERVFDFEKFFLDVKNALDEHPNVVVAVSEGVRLADGKYVGEGSQSGISDVFGHKYLAGTGKALEIAVRERFGCKVRSIELSLPQRCAAHLQSAADIEESVRVGRAAVRAAQDGASCVMMIIERVGNEPYRSEIGYSDIEAIANRAQGVPDEFINSEGNHITKKCAEYVLPLIKGEVTPVFRDGLPVHCIIK